MFNLTSVSVAAVMLVALASPGLAIETETLHTGSGDDSAAGLSTPDASSDQKSNPGEVKKTFGNFTFSIGSSQWGAFNQAQDNRLFGQPFGQDFGNQGQWANGSGFSALGIVPGGNSGLTVRTLGSETFITGPHGATKVCHNISGHIFCD